MCAYEFEIPACERQTQYSQFKFQGICSKSNFFQKSLVFPKRLVLGPSKLNTKDFKYFSSLLLMSYMFMG